MASRVSRRPAPQAVSPDQTLALVRSVVRALDEKKADDLRVLSVGAFSTITDYLVLASGKANPHLRALRIELEKTLDAAGAPIAGVETSEGSGWIVFDAYQIMIHLFMPEQRSNYKLEQLWRDAEEIAVEALLAPDPVPAPAVKRAPAKRSAAKKVPAKKAALKKAPAPKAPAKRVAAVKSAPASAKPVVRKGPRKQGD